jgi:hypothetical protein
MKIWQIIVIILISFSLFTLLILRLPLIFTGKLILNLASRTGLSIGIILLLTSIILFTQQLKKERVKKVEEQKKLVQKLYKELEAYLLKGDYLSAEALLEYRIGSVAELRIHHNNPETYRYARPIGVAAAEAMYLCHKHIGKVPPIGKPLLTAFYSLHSKYPEIVSTAMSSLEKFVLYLRRKHYNWKRIFKSEKVDEWINFWKKMYQLNEKRRNEIYQKYGLIKLNLYESFKDLYTILRKYKKEKI